MRAPGAPTVAIRFLARATDGSFTLQGTREQLLLLPVRNEDLPNLRADWVRQQIRPAMTALHRSDIAILENPPTGDSERTVDLILNVDW